MMEESEYKRQETCENKQTEQQYQQNENDNSDIQQKIVNIEQNEKMLTLSDKVSQELLKLKKGYENQLEKKEKQQFLVNTSKARSELKVLKYLIKLYKWKEVWGMDGDVLWSGLQLNEDDCSLPLQIKTNRIPGMPDLCHKKTMGYYLKKFREYFPEEYDFFPRTFLIPEELEEFTNYSKKQKMIFIAKPSSGCQGDGIKIIKTPKELNLSYYTPRMNELIVQHYVDNPLLINKRKFDFRLYVLISSVEPFIVYLHEEGLVRFCVEEYQTPINETNFKNVYMHLTNYSLNKDHPDFKPSNQQTNIFDINDTSKRTLTSVLKELKSLNIDIEKVQSDIEILLVKFLTSMYPFILNNMKTAFQKSDNAKCFHVLGFDILLDSKYKPWLLEVNNNPSFSIDHEIYKSDGTTITEESDLDKYIKTRVIGDAIMLTTQSDKKQLQIGNGGMYRGFKQIICGEIEDKQLELFTQILKIYGSLSGFKFRGTISASKFIKLANLQGMTNEKLIKVDYDILFKKLLCNNYQSQQMDFFDFIRAIETLASKLIENYSPINKQPYVSQLVQSLVSQIK